MPVHVRARACPPTPQSTHPTCPLHRAQRLQQALPPPVHGVVVGQAGHVDAGRREDGDVGCRVWQGRGLGLPVGGGCSSKGYSGDAGDRTWGRPTWVHAVVDALVGPGHRVRGDSGLQIYHPGLRLPALHGAWAGACGTRVGKLPAGPGCGATRWRYVARNQACLPSMQAMAPRAQSCTRGQS